MPISGFGWHLGSPVADEYDLAAITWGFDYTRHQVPVKRVPAVRLLVPYFAEQREHLAELDDDWDFEGALAPSEEALQRFDEVVQSLLAAVPRFSVPRMPIVSPCPDGSIDMLWKGNNAQILINISDKREPIVTANVRGTRFRHTAHKRNSKEYNWGAIPSMLRQL